MNEGNDKKKAGKNGKMKCEDIQAVLFDYMTRELGPARSDLVREHMRKCDACRAAAAEIKATLDLLQKASKSTEEIMPSRLTRRRRKRIIRAMMHPVWDWISINHFVVSIIIMGLVILAALLILKKLEPWRLGDAPPKSVTVTIGGGAPEEQPKPAPPAPPAQ